MSTGLPVQCRYYCQTLINLEFSRKIFEKYPNIKCHENPSIGSRVVPCGRTDGHDEANSRFSPFCESALKPSNSMKDHAIKNPETVGMNLTVTLKNWIQTNEALYRPNCNQALSVTNKH